MSMENKLVIVSFFVLCFVAVLGSSAGIYYYYQYRSLVERTNNPSIAVSEVLTKVGKLIDLPQDETPTVATITNPDAIRSQAFFAKAKKGDKVILYKNARLAILFDEEANKIVNFGSINQDQASESSVPAQ